MNVQPHPTLTTPPLPSRRAAAALRYAALGWPVLPLHTPDDIGRCSCRRHDCPKPGKHPRSRHGLRDASTDPAQLHAWWTTWPDANVGVATGHLVVVDVDGPEGRDSLAELERDHDALPATLAATTGRGSHVYFAAGPHRLTNSAGRLGAGLDIRGHGGYVVVPPSRHADGDRYRWSTRHAPAPLPSWLARLLTSPSSAARVSRPPAPTATGGGRRRRYFAAALRAELGDVAAAQPGTRNDTLNRAAFRLAQLAASGHGSLEELSPALLHAAVAAGLSETEAFATIDSGLRAGQQHPRPTPLAVLPSDVVNAAERRSAAE